MRRRSGGVFVALLPCSCGQEDPILSVIKSTAPPLTWLRSTRVLSQLVYLDLGSGPLSQEDILPHYPQIHQFHFEVTLFPSGRKRTNSSSPCETGAREDGMLG